MKIVLASNESFSASTNTDSAGVQNSVALGSNARVRSGKTNSVAIGTGADVNADTAVQISSGTNTTSKSLQFRDCTIAKEFTINGEKHARVPLASLEAAVASADHTHSSIVAGDTTVSAVNGGTATISYASSTLLNPKVTFPDGFSAVVSMSPNNNKTYTAPAGGETLEFTGPYEVAGGQVTTGFWIPSNYTGDPANFNPSADNGYWFFECSPRDPDGIPYYFGFGAVDDGKLYTVHNFDSPNPYFTYAPSEYSRVVSVVGDATITRSTITKTIATTDQLPTSVTHMISSDGTVTVTAQNDGTVTIEKPGAEIDMDDPLSSLIEYLGLPAGSTFDEVRQALGLPVGATLQDAANAVPSSINQIVAVTDDLRYNLAEAAPTVSSGAASVTVSDRSITSFTLESGVTSLAITPPAAVSGKARDFFCRVTVSGSSGPGTVTLGTGQTIDIGASELAGMTTGINVLMFTEIASGHWMVSRKSAS